MRRHLVVPAVFICCACSSPEYRIGAKDGIPAIAGSTEVTLDLNCGTPISAGDFTVTTAKVTDGCLLTFDKDVEIVKASDYSQIPAFQGGASLLQSVELLVRKLDFTDTSTSPGTKLNPETSLTSATASINGQLVVADKSALSALPKTVTLSGNALSGVKAKVDARQPAFAHITAVLVIPNTPPPPKKMKIDYDSQPTLVLGTGAISL